MKEIIKLGLVEDHVLLRNGLAELLTILGYEVILQCDNGKDLVETLDRDNLPDIILMDIHMPIMDGFDTALWVTENYPMVRVLALSMHDDEPTIVRMIKNGTRGYILKDSSPKELQQSINAVMTKGFYYSERVTGRLIHSIRDLEEKKGDTKNLLQLSEREIEFLKYVSTEMTYRQIAGQMHLSPRTIDGYREALFEKLNAKSRIGLVLYAIKKRIVQMN